MNLLVRYCDHVLNYPLHSNLLDMEVLKGLRMVARALWRSEARRVVPWSETLHEP